MKTISAPLARNKVARMQIFFDLLIKIQKLYKILILLFLVTVKSNELAEHMHQPKHCIAAFKSIIGSFC